MARHLRLLIGLAIVVAGCAPARPGSVAGTDRRTGWVVHQAPNPHPNPAYAWLEVALEATARDVDRVGARPPIISREVSIYVTAMYDAWAAYDDKAVGTRLGGALRRPPAERTAASKETAIAYAVHRALEYLYPADRPWLAEQMRAAGHDPDDRTTDVAKPQGIGNVAAAALIAYRRHDGANQDGDEIGSSGKPYSDYTRYKPRNPVDRIVDPDRWQPIPFDNAKGETFYPNFLTPHWYRVKPFALDRSDQFRPPAPPKVGSDQLKKEVDEVIQFNATLTNEQKAIVEFMRDGPRSTGQSGHWLRFAQDVSRRDKHNLDQDVKLFFSISNVAMDAFIAAWESKRYYDTSRLTLVRVYYAGRNRRLVHPGKNVNKIASASGTRIRRDVRHAAVPWLRSGHSTGSGACAKPRARRLG
jgi:hypothetical protein